MTTPPRGIEVITRGEKREIVAESLRPGVRPSEIVHKHGITSVEVLNAAPHISALGEPAMPKRLAIEPSLQKHIVDRNRGHLSLPQHVHRAVTKRLKPKRRRRAPS